MRAQVQTWGDSLALCIPEAFALESGLELGSDVDISLENGRLIITPLDRHKSRLDELISRITEQNRHEEILAGPPLGDESW